MIIRLALALTALAGIVAGCAGPAATAPQVQQPAECNEPRIVLGEVDVGDHKRVMEGMQPLVTYLATQLRDLGIQCGSVRVASRPSEMATLLRKGEVDVYFDSVYPAALVIEASGAQPILRRWPNCDPEYHSVIFASTESGITSVEALLGHMIAMDTSYSTSGFALPSAYLMDRGLKLVVKPTADAPVAEDEVGIWFAETDLNAKAAFLNGKILVVATDDYRYTNEWPASVKDDLVLLAETQSVPRQVVLVRPGIPAELSAAIKRALLGAEADPTAALALDTAQGTCRFDEFPEGIEAALLEMHDLAESLKGIDGLSQR